MTQLSDREIEEAAREAGISPAELRSALAEQASGGGPGPGGGAIATRGQRGVVPPSTRGVSVANTETSLPYPPEQAVRSVKRQIERQIGSGGHMMGSTEADIYDEAAGIIYRVQAEADGASGSMVRVDIDPTPLRSRRTLTSMGLGATVGLFAITGLIVPGLIGWALIAGAVGLTVLGSTSMVALRQRAIKDARAISAQALVEAENAAPIGGAGQLDAAEADHRPKALPPGSDW
ncbi:hypothetical protein ENSA5_65950 [Enhygromyxa salina]|uniref:Uncharacterized protein n=1 Tax=Enhygromyxa salina TaxID=215803 RepID=A0A2S9XBR8_9BACT|nr:hypothetical protein [Enhygromyxa salina]PRP90299.1 hypothetical protein ENSA5_65950 [Enhygromyxa salina]